MSVAGDISEMPLPELLSVLSNRNGVLRMQSVPFMSRVDVHIDNGHLTGCLVDDRSLRKECQTIDKLVAVSASPSGSFQFIVTEAKELAHRFKIHTHRAALLVASRVDEILASKPQFAPAGQVFRWSGMKRNAPKDDEGLQEFILDAADILRFGSNAERLASIVQLSVPQVQYYLYILGLAECVIPLGRDALWSKFNRTMETKSSGLRLAQEKATGSPGFDPAPAKPRQMPSSTGQKMVPVLGRRKDGKDEAAPQEGRITRLIQ